MNRGTLIPLNLFTKGENMSMKIDQVIQMGRAIGLIKPDTPQKNLSHDPLLGYDKGLLTRICGSVALDKIIQTYHSNLLEMISSREWSVDDHIFQGHSFTVSRGKSKGFQGIAIRHMPSKYEEGAITFILYDPFTSQEVFCNQKSARLTPWRRGETGLLASHIESGRTSALVRGQQVYSQDKVGAVVAPPKQRNGSPLYSVGVQWQGEAQEAWTFPHLLMIREP
ncbi:MAG: hypothetical protein EB165_06960 [Euryarchaeota archaeon]|nr:hypothetical protein [Euryarchaeota archaeon]NDB94360.1 hypothetical protein [Euryarchaeota archaeon]